jgi:ectoine hydroxylase-related dioxygenase (phytanoyl-CoA dioxygenase family)
LTHRFIYRYDSIISEGEKMATLNRFARDADINAIIAAITSDGAVIVEQFLSDDVLDSFNAELNPLLEGRAPNHGSPNAAVEAFHGAQTKHVTGVAAYSDTFVEHVLLHPLYAALGDHFLRPSCADYQLNIGHVLQRGPGSGDQMIHRDQDVWPRALADTMAHRQFASVIALSNFTVDNGATRVVPGSHNWSEEREPELHEVAVAAMPAGSAVLYLGSTLHSAGPNHTTDARRGMHMSFCLGWLRTEENNCLSVPLDRVRMLPRRAQELLGFGLHDGLERGEGFLGAVDNRNPLDLLAAHAL